MKLKLPQKETVIFCIAIIGIVACIILNSLALSKISDMSKSFSDQTVKSESNISREQELLQTKAKYKLYECGGKIGIYDADSNTIIDIIDILVYTLPKSDRAALKKGIEVFSISELSNIIDDFSS